MIPRGDGLDLLRVLREGRPALAHFLGLPAYRGEQIAQWVFDKGVTEAAAMTSLPRDLRDELPSRLGPLAPQVVERCGGVEAEKLLVRVAGGQAVECVALMRPWGLSVCVSSQLGCPVGCRFCASGQYGLRRDLEGEEIAGQVLAVARERGVPRRIVFMGMGEPLLNLKGVLDSLVLLCDGHAYRVPERSITVSTVGWAKGIDRLAGSGRRVRLAVSVHAVDPCLRAELIPGQPDPLPEVLAAAKRYEEVSGRRVTYEYALIAGVNDRPEHAAGLADMLGQGAHVNLIGLNPVDGAAYAAPRQGRLRRFMQVLAARGMNVTARRSAGGGVDAACGQLRSRWVRPNGMG